MSIIVNLLLLVATTTLFYKLVTTNHWTSGKKNLVAIIGCLLWKLIVETVYVFFFYLVIPGNFIEVVSNVPLALSMIFITLMVTWSNE